MVKIIGRILYHCGALGFGLYIGLLGAKHHQEVNRIEHNLLHGDRTPALNFFQDPFGLEINYEINAEVNIIFNISLGYQ